MKFRFSKDFVVDSDVAPWRREGLRIAMLGGPGSGKSWNNSLIAEQFLSQGGTVVIFQPRDEYFTLKEKFDVLSVGGVHATDMEFALTSPSIYAKAVVEDGMSMIFYTSAAEDEEKLINWVSRFIQHLLTYQEKQKRPLLLILEEAQEYAPRSASGHVAPPWVYNRMIKAFKDCFTQGRKLNVIGIASSQRPQELNFTIRQLANLTFFGKFSDQDIGYVDKECLKYIRKQGIEIDASKLVTLGLGEWLVVMGKKTGFLKVTHPRLTKHGAETPRLEYVAPRTTEAKKTIDQLTQTIMDALKKEETEESELEKAKRKIWKNGLRYIRSETGEIAIQRYICRECGRRFSEDTGLGSYLQPNRHVFNRCSGLSTCQVSVTETEGTKNLSHQRTRQKQAAGATTSDIKGTIVEYMWHLKKHGYREGTIERRIEIIKRLIKLGADLWDPESVKKIMAIQETWSIATKDIVRQAYSNFVEMEGLTWQPPKYTIPEKLPFIPLQKEIDLLINACGKRVSIFLQGLKETGADPSELLATEWIDLNEEKRIIAINHPVKGHNARILPVSNDFIGRLQLLPKKSQRIFSTTMNNMYTNFWGQRKRTAHSFNNPRIEKVTFTSIRHWKATIEYHRTKDILHVKHLLGHKSLNSTMIYIDIERAIYGELTDDEFTVRVAKTLEEDRELIEVGFEYVTERKGAKIYRKRK